MGNVPNMQSFDVTSGRYEPDYTLTPLTIDPEVAAIQGDTPLAVSDARKLLANMHWYEIGADGTVTEILLAGPVSTPVGYTVVNTKEGDALAGRIQVAKNAHPGSPLQLRFEADLLSGSDVFHIEKDINVICRDSTPAVQCKFDTPDIVDYNPIRDTTELPVQLRVWENGRDAPAAHFIPVWEVRRGDGTWSEYGSELTDYWMTVAADSMSAKIRLDLMGYGVSVRVRLKYDRECDPASVILDPDDLSMPFCRLECLRTFRKYDSKMIKMPASLREWMTEVTPEIYFEDNDGQIMNPDTFFRTVIYACPVGRSLTVADVVATGCKARIPTSISGGKAMHVGYSVDELSPLLALTYDGAYLTVGGALLLAKK